MKLIIVSMALLAMASATETNQELDQGRLFIPVSFFNDNFGILDSMQRGTAFGVLALALVGMVILSASVFLTAASIKRRSDIQEYYQNDQQPARFRRFAPNDIASKMAQLEQAFKKYQVTEAECEMYIACEASQVNRHEENGPLAKIIFDIISTFNRAKDSNKWDDRMEGLVQAFEYGTGAQAAGQVDACEPLRNKCFELHASTKY